MTPSNSAWPWPICRSASSCACVRGVASTLTPTAQPPTGRPRRHGSKLVCDDPATWPSPTRPWTATDPQLRPRFCLQAWSGLHAAPQNHATRGTRQTTPARARERSSGSTSNGCPGPQRLPIPLWFWWSGSDAPRVGRGLACLHRPVLAGAHLPLLQANPALDHAQTPLSAALLTAGPGSCSWPTCSSAWHVMRSADVRLPWQAALPRERRTPARVRRAFSHLLTQLGSPVCVPKPCGRSPGRPKGTRSPPAKRFPAVKLTS